jgi:hypothetical protein
MRFNSKKILFYVEGVFMCCMILTIKICYFSLNKYSFVHYVEEAECLDYCDVITVFIIIVWMNFKLSVFDIDVVHAKLF